MASNPTPIPTAPITLSVSDPVSADIQVVAGAATALFNFLCTPAGQQLVVKQMAAETKFEDAFSRIFGSAFNALHKFLTGAK
jgi:hypothetical protein